MRGLCVAIRSAQAQPPHPPHACGAGPLPLPGGARAGCAVLACAGGGA
ncbi:hypothetical protein [Azospirillum argentinense]